MGASNLQIAESYHNEGLNLAASEESADFLATELEFLYYLGNGEASAAQACKAATVAGWRQKQATFCRELLHPWLAVFCQWVKQSESRHPLYSWAADVLTQFSQREQVGFAC